MIRWLRAAVAVAAVLVVLALGSLLALLTEANSTYVAVKAHPWLAPALDPLIGAQVVEIQLPALLAGWVIAAIAVAGLLAATVLHAWRRRQYESLIARLEHELVRLRNLPISAPAPLEDLPEHPDAEAARDLDLALGQTVGLGTGQAGGQGLGLARRPVAGASGLSLPGRGDA
jgi:hypothetical protein